MNLADRIIDMLGQGLPGNVIASAVGCDPSYISQLMENEDTRTIVAEKRAVRAEAGLQRDAKWDKVEDLALDRAISMLPLLTKPSELVRVATLANAAKRRSTEVAGINDSTAPVVTLNLPQAAVVNFQMNVNSQVIAVDGRSMQALPTNKLAKMVEQPIADIKDSITIDTPAPVVAQRKKVVSTLETLGYADEPFPVPAILHVPGASDSATTEPVGRLNSAATSMNTLNEEVCG